MSEKNNKSVALIVAMVVLVALLGAGAYFSLGGKKADSVPAPQAEQVAQTEAPQEPETPIVEGEVPPQPETPQNIVVETKTLDMPPAEVADADAPPAAEAVAAEAVTSSPDVAAMMSKRSVGKADAPVKITEYSSLTCSHCAHVHKDVYPQLKEKFIDTGIVELTFKEFPLNPPAADASAILRCMPEDKFVSFMNLLFDSQDNWAYKPEYKDILRQNAKLAGMSDERFDACLANDELKKRIISDMQEASKAYEIRSTPSFIVEGRKEPIVGAQPLEFFEKVITEMQQKQSPAAGQAQPAQ